MPGLSNNNNLDIVVRTQADTKGLKEAESGVRQLSGETERTGKLAGLAGIAHTAFGVAAGIALQNAAFKAVDFAKSTVASFAQSESMIAQTNAVLKSTGGIAGVTADEVDKLSKSLEHQTKFSDEDVRSVENMLLTFTSLKKDVFPQATKTVLNMATALGEDTKSASIQLGKALQDPINGITALRRVGVNFSDSQKEVIKQLVDTGQTAKAQQLILKELNTEFGGSAVAAGNTFAGQMAKLKNRFDDFKEVIGGFIVKEGLQLFNLFTRLGNNRLFEQMVHNLGVAFRDTVIFVRLLWDALTGGDPTLKKGEERFAGIAKVMAALGFAFDEVRTGVKLVWEAFRGGDPTLDKNHLQMAGFVKILLQVKDIATQVAHTIGGVLQVAWQGLHKAIELIMPSVRALISAFASNLLPTLRDIWNSLTRLYDALQPALMDVLKVLAVIVGVTLYAALYIFINALRISIEVLHALVVVFATVVGWVSNFIGWIGTAAVAVANAVGAMARWFGSLPGAISHVWQEIRQAVINLINDLVSFFASLPDRAVKAVGNIGSRIGNDIKNALHSIHIPGFATGVQNFGGGMAWVGERGPELVKLPAGSSVYTNSQSQAMTPGNNTQNTFTGNIMLGSAGAVTEFFKQINQDTLLAAKGLTVRQGA